VDTGWRQHKTGLDGYKWSVACDALGVRRYKSGKTSQCEEFASSRTVHAQ